MSEDGGGGGGGTDLSSSSSCIKSNLDVASKGIRFNEPTTVASPVAILCKLPFSVRALQSSLIVIL